MMPPARETLATPALETLVSPATPRRKRPIYSHSRLSSFEDCPKKFHYRYVLKIPSDTDGIEGFVGKRVHEVLERLYGAVGRGHVPSHAQLIHRYRTLWDESYDAERVRIVRVENPPEFYRELGERCLTNYYRNHYPFDGDETVGIEHRVAFPLDDSNDYRIQGFIDRIVRASDSVLEIHDYKTGARVPSQKSLDSDRQLALYEIGVRREMNVTGPIRLIWHYLQRDQTRVSTRTSDQLVDLRGKTIELIDRIDAEEAWEPKTGPLCGWCEYQDRCPAKGGTDSLEIAAAPSEPTPPAESPRSAAKPPTGQLSFL